MKITDLKKGDRLEYLGDSSQDLNKGDVIVLTEDGEGVWAKGEYEKNGMMAIIFKSGLKEFNKLDKETTPC